MKKFSQQAAANFVPLLARIILFLAFVPAGWHHAMDMGDFQGDAGARLRELGIVSVEKSDSGCTLVVSRVASRQDVPPIPTTALDAMGYQSRSLHELTLVFDRFHLPRPQIWAWTVTVFELIGGALLLIGLFSRVWAGGLAVWSLALLLLSTPSLTDSWFALWTTTDPNAVLPRSLALSQLSLIVLASGLLLTGPGKLSLDGLIFRGSGGGDGDA